MCLAERVKSVPEAQRRGLGPCQALQMVRQRRAQREPGEARYVAALARSSSF